MMPLPKKFYKSIQPLRNDGHFIYLVRIDDVKDGCGYFKENQKDLEPLELSDFDKFKKMPSSWKEVKPMKIKLKTGV